MYGGLGSAKSAGLHDTSHYLAPGVAWNLPSDWTLRLSSGFGLNDNSHRLVLRWGVSREFSGFGETVRRWFGAGREQRLRFVSVIPQRPPLASPAKLILA
jgi:hypothetical protein